MEVLGLSQIVLAPTHQVATRWIFLGWMRIDVDLIAISQGLLSDHFALKIRLSISTLILPFLDRELFYVHPETNESNCFPECSAGSDAPWWLIRWACEGLVSLALRNHQQAHSPVPSSLPYQTSPLVHTEAAENEAAAKRLEQGWWCSHNETARKSYRMFMKSFEMTMRPLKKGFYVASVAFMSSHPAVT